MNANILLVDDSTTIAELVLPELEEAGYGAFHAEDADAAFAFLRTETIDLLLLDIDLPGVSGLQMLKLLKADASTARLPVIMLTVHDEDRLKVQGLKGGADDYVTKPFSGPVLLARIEALLRRTRDQGDPERRLEGGTISVDVKRREVTAAGKRVALTAAEFEFLCTLLQRKGEIVRSQTLADALSRKGREVTSGTLYMHARDLRAKLGAAAKPIETVYGMGYRFIDE